MLQRTSHRLQELKRVGVAVVAGLLLGVLFGHTAWFIAGALAMYLSWTLAELLRLHRWAGTENPGEAPESAGLWGEIFDNIHRLQRRALDAQDELRSIIDRARDSVTALSDAVVLVRRDSTLEWWNPAAERLLGLRWPADCDQNVTNLLRDPRFRQFFEQGDYGRTLEMPSPADDDLHLQVQVTVFGNGDHLLIARDITRLHQMEQTRRDFVANVSHELRTPLTVIRGYIETLSQSGDAPPRYARAFSQMATQATRMERLVEDLLLLSRLESTPPDNERARIAIGPLLERIRQDVAEAARDRGHRISLRLSGNEDLVGSAHELHGAFSNILVNAARYTEPGGDIDIHWWVDEKGAHLAVRDTGIGIDPKHVPRLTERFYRTDKGRSVAEGGTGLGLAIVKHALKRHDGWLEIHSEPGKGSTFTCHFPQHRIALPGAHPNGRNPAAG